MILSDKNKDKIIESCEYFCQENKTYVLKTSNGKFHTLIFKLNKVAIDEIE